MNTIKNDNGVIEWRFGQAGTAELYNIVANGPGQGKILLAEAMQQMSRSGASRVYLFTETKNDRAHRFYERHGFERVAKIDGFYRNGDAYMYLRLI